jgi:hypothetical protein
VDYADARRRDHDPHAQRRGRDCQSPEDRLRLLRARVLRHRHGGELLARQEARAPLRRLAQRRIRREEPLRRRAKGVERIVELELNASEREMFDKSAAAVKALVDACIKIAPDLGK